MDKSEHTETYTVAQIREAFAKHAGKDGWGVPKMSEVSLTSALRGEYDAPRGIQPGDLCRFVSDYQVDHHGCDDFADGTITDVRTGKVVR